MSPAGRRSDQRRSDGGPTATWYLGTVNTASKYHIVFGEEKSKIMIMELKNETKKHNETGEKPQKTTNT